MGSVVKTLIWFIKRIAYELIIRFNFGKYI
jgi:hypothetical protein